MTRRRRRSRCGSRWPFQRIRRSCGRLREGPPNYARRRCRTASRADTRRRAWRPAAARGTGSRRSARRLIHSVRRRESCPCSSGHRASSGRCSSRPASPRRSASRPDRWGRRGGVCRSSRRTPRPRRATAAPLRRTTRRRTGPRPRRKSTPSPRPRPRRASPWEGPSRRAHTPQRRSKRWCRDRCRSPGRAARRAGLQRGWTCPPSARFSGNGRCR